MKYLHPKSIDLTADSALSPSGSEFIGGSVFLSFLFFFFKTVKICQSPLLIEEIPSGSPF